MIGQRIRYHRKRKGLTLEQLSEGICSVSYLSKIEHGDKSSAEISRLLCEKLNIEVGDVNPTETLSHVNKEIDNWYHQIVTTPKPGDLILYKEDLESKVLSLQDPFLSIKFELMCFYFYTTLQHYNHAYVLKEELESFEEMFTPELHYYFLLFSGVYFSSTSHLDEAEDCLYKAEKLHETLPHSDQDEAELFYQIGRMECIRYHVPKCIQYASNALSTFNKFYNLKRIADCQTLLGISHRRINNFTEAETHFEQALKFVSILNNAQRTSILYDNLAYCYVGKNNHVLAIDYLLRSIDLKKQHQEPKSAIASSLTLLAEEYFRTNAFDEARQTVTQAMDLIEDPEHSIDFLKLTVLSYQLATPIHPDYETFMRQRVIPTLSERNMWEEVSTYSEQLAEYFFERHQYKLASIYFKQANHARKHILQG